MNNLLKIEWLKLKNYTAFIVMTIFFLVGVFALNYIVYTVNKNIVRNVPGAGLVSFSPYNFPNTWQSTSYATGFILVLPALLLLMLFTNEYSFKTHRQNIIDGLSRQQFISIKFVMAFIFALVATLLVFISALLFGLASGTSFSFQGIENVGYFFLKALSYNLIAILFSVLVKRTGFAIGIFFIYLGAENIMSQLLNVLSIKLKNENKIDIGNIGDYLPMNAADSLLAFPDNPIKSMSKTIMPTDYTWVVFILAVVYIVVFYLWSRHKFINADL
ncbi:MAG: ABC transporter permease [Ferruginibacter sp.]|nr:ABC transporter permease [Bacteroidota bacterium]MBX2919981.1 ABC transporter permease [Ferruginibacter sp.]MCB0708832.1 ABC transporter permease [Chitinophagaceae bacterium]